MIKVLCFGSLNIDYTYQVDHFVRKGETLLSDSLAVFCGGKGLNQSIALAKAGVRTFHAGAAGEDGRFLLDILDRSGVDTSCVRILPDVRTGNAIIQNDREGDNCILLYGGANQGITRDHVDEVLARFGRGDYLLLQNEINELPYLMGRASGMGMRIVLNPSPLNEKIFELPLGAVDYFLLNEVEAAALLWRGTKPDPGADSDAKCAGEAPGPDPKAMASALSGKYPHASIVLTIGSGGSIFADGRKQLCQPIYPVRTVDTTAAGDTFTGYFIAGILEGLSEEKAMDLAARAAAIAVTRPGAAPSIPERAEVEGYF